MRKLSRILLLLSLVMLCPPATAQKKAAFPPQDFAKVNRLLCNPETLDELKAARRTCRLDDFVVEGHDLDGDGKPEWLFYGPSGVCGAHGNCPLNIVRGEGARHVLLGKDCGGSSCLGWGNAHGSEVLKTTHNGYRDLQIASDAGSFYWSKSVYQWDGNAYRATERSTTYYLYDQTADRLRKVTKARWDACMKSGARCF